MFNQKKQRDAARNIFVSSVHGLGNVGAVILTFFLVPLMFNNTAGFVGRFTEHNYGSDFVDLAVLAWFVMLSFLIFFMARASLSTLLVMGGLALAMRFL